MALQIIKLALHPIQRLQSIRAKSFIKELLILCVSILNIPFHKLTSTLITVPKSDATFQHAFN